MLAQVLTSVTAARQARSAALRERSIKLMCLPSAGAHSRGSGLWRRAPVCARSCKRSQRRKCHSRCAMRSTSDFPRSLRGGKSDQFPAKQLSAVRRFGTDGHARAASLTIPDYTDTQPELAGAEPRAYPRWGTVLGKFSQLFGSQLAVPKDFVKQAGTDYLA